MIISTVDYYVKDGVINKIEHVDLPPHLGYPHLWSSGGENNMELFCRHANVLVQGMIIKDESLVCGWFIVDGLYRLARGSVDNLNI